MLELCEIKLLGTIEMDPLVKEFGEVRTNEVIVTRERLRHILERHPDDFELFETYGVECIENPDYIIKNNKNEGTIFVVKKLGDTNLNAIVRVVLEKDQEELKNSVMTFYRIRDKNLKKLIKRNKLLYKKEYPLYNNHTI